MEVLVITPVKDSLETTRQTIEAVSRAEGDFEYYIFNDFSGTATREFLENNKKTLPYHLVNLETITHNPSPNYKLILQMAQEKAKSENVPLLLIESDVIIRKETIKELVTIASNLKNPGLVGAVTVDKDNNYNFPYGYVKSNTSPILNTRRSLSFCCTLISVDFLNAYDFKMLSEKKDWYDVYISRCSRRFGFNNYLIINSTVLHLPHSSRPWKQLKYTQPLKYYFNKLIRRRDRI
jgi:hypothetical protein